MSALRSRVRRLEDEVRHLNEQVLGIRAVVRRYDKAFRIVLGLILRLQRQTNQLFDYLEEHLSMYYELEIRLDRISANAIYEEAGALIPLLTNNIDPEDEL